ncbi:MAG: hypothetical protein JRG73_09410 [Deltaproteobacteria bacterium]|nr:hypothetical protein [Deltaproteobacteria bacterium]
MSTREEQLKLVENMKQWQKVEDATVAKTASVMEETDNPLIRLVMEIIQRDANLHHRVQQLIIDSLERGSIPITVEDLQKVWISIEEHIQIERNATEMAKSSLSALQGRAGIVQHYLISYLMEDEKKHEKLLSNLEQIKKGMYP